MLLPKTFVYNLYPCIACFASSLIKVAIFYSLVSLVGSEEYNGTLPKLYSKGCRSNGLTWFSELPT